MYVCWGKCFPLLYFWRTVLFCLQYRRFKRHRFNPWVRRTLWRRKWQHTPVFLLGESHGQGSQAGYSPWGHKQSDTIEHAPTHPFCWEEYSGLAVFSFITLNISFSLLDSKASVEKSTDSIMMVPLYVRGCFLPATF